MNAGVTISDIQSATQRGDALHTGITQTRKLTTNLPLKKPSDFKMKPIS